MQVSEQKLKYWNSIKERGDISAIAAIIGKSYATVARLTSKGTGTSKDIQKVDLFFERKKTRLKKSSIEVETD